MSNPITPLTPEQFKDAEAAAAQERYPMRVAVAVDQMANVALGGRPDETISSRAARAALQGKFWGRALSRLLNLFQKDHGAEAEAGDLERAQAIAATEIATGVLPTM